MTDDAQMKIRLPRDLKERIEAAAVAANRSWNGEIVSRLERSFDPAVKLLPSEQIHEMILGDHNVTLADLEARLQKVEDHLGFSPKPAKGK